jgi:hypothetical protein
MQQRRTSVEKAGVFLLLKSVEKRSDFFLRMSFVLTARTDSNYSYFLMQIVFKGHTVSFGQYMQTIQSDNKNFMFLGVLTKQSETLIRK